MRGDNLPSALQVSQLCDTAYSHLYASVRLLPLMSVDAIRDAADTPPLRSGISTTSLCNFLQAVRDFYVHNTLSASERAGLSFQLSSVTKNCASIFVTCQQDGVAVAPCLHQHGLYLLGLIPPLNYDSLVEAKVVVDGKLSADPNVISEYITGKFNFVESMETNVVSTLDGVVQLPVATFFSRTSGGAESVADNFKLFIEHLIICSCCLLFLIDQRIVNTLDVDKLGKDKICDRYCRQCLLDRAVCASCVSAGFKQFDPANRVCSRCTAFKQLCVSVHPLVHTSDSFSPQQKFRDNLATFNNMLLERAAPVESDARTAPRVRFADVDAPYVPMVVVGMSDSAHNAKNMRNALCHNYIYVAGHLVTILLLLPLRREQFFTFKELRDAIFRFKDMQALETLCDVAAVAERIPDKYMVQTVVPEYNKFWDTNNHGVWGKEPFELVQLVHLGRETCYIILLQTDTGSSIKHLQLNHCPANVNSVWSSSDVKLLSVCVLLTRRVSQIVICGVTNDELWISPPRGVKNRKTMAFSSFEQHALPSGVISTFGSLTTVAALGSDCLLIGTERGRVFTVSVTETTASFDLDFELMEAAAAAVTSLGRGPRPRSRGSRAFEAPGDHCPGSILSFTPLTSSGWLALSRPPSATLSASPSMWLFELGPDGCVSPLGSVDNIFREQLPTEWRAGRITALSPASRLVPREPVLYAVVIALELPAAFPQLARRGLFRMELSFPSERPSSSPPLVVSSCSSALFECDVRQLAVGALNDGVRGALGAVSSIAPPIGRSVFFIDCEAATVRLITNPSAMRPWLTICKHLSSLFHFTTRAEDRKSRFPINRTVLDLLSEYTALVSEPFTDIVRQNTVRINVQHGEPEAKDIGFKFTIANNMCGRQVYAAIGEVGNGLGLLARQLQSMDLPPLRLAPSVLTSLSVEQHFSQVRQHATTMPTPVEYVFRNQALVRKRLSRLSFYKRAHVDGPTPRGTLYATDESIELSALRQRCLRVEPSFKSISQRTVQRAEAKQREESGITGDVWRQRRAVLKELESLFRRAPQNTVRTQCKERAGTAPYMGRFHRGDLKVPEEVPGEGVAEGEGEDSDGDSVGSSRRRRRRRRESTGSVDSDGRGSVDSDERGSAAAARAPGERVFFRKGNILLVGPLDLGGEDDFGDVELSATGLALVVLECDCVGLQRDKSTVQAAHLRHLGEEFYCRTENVIELTGGLLFGHGGLNHDVFVDREAQAAVLDDIGLALDDAVLAGPLFRLDAQAVYDIECYRSAVRKGEGSVAVTRSRRSNAGQRRDRDM